MVSALRSVLAVDATAVDYLAPLLDASRRPVQVATLNYDRSIESLAARAGRVCDTGVENWSGAFDWAWSGSADIRLLKLHGSIDWWYVRRQSDEGRMSEESIEVDASDDGRGWNSRLAVIFGQRGKLRSDGPFLAMLRALDEFLANSTHLVVVGHSFRDEHINASIRRWFNRAADARVTLIDPALADIEDWGQSRSQFLQELLSAMTVEGRAPTWERELRGLHEVRAEPASSGLRACFGEGPVLSPAQPPSHCGPLR